MTSNQNPFEELFKQWTEQSQKYTQNPEIINAITKNFITLQKEILSLYESKNSTSANNDIPHDIYDALIMLTRRINELEDRIKQLESGAGTSSETDK